MTNILYSNLDTMGVDMQRGGCEISKTDKGIAVTQVSLYSDKPTTIKYYSEYPELPADWARPINDTGTTELQLFMHLLDGYSPYRTVTK